MWVDRLWQFKQPGDRQCGGAEFFFSTTATPRKVEGKKVVIAEDPGSMQLG